MPPPHVIGPKLTLDRSGFATIKIGCTALSGSCSGNVLVLTIGRFRTVHGGPVGRLRVMFAYVTVPAGQTIVVRRAVLGPVARVLRRYPGIGLSVKVTFSQLPAPVSAVRYLHVAP